MSKEEFDYFDYLVESGSDLMKKKELRVKEGETVPIVKDDVAKDSKKKKSSKWSRSTWSKWNQSYDNDNKDFG